MYAPFREEKLISFKLPWDKNTARGFGISLILTIILISIFSQVKVEPIKPVEYEIKRIPLELINFGAGDGTGASKGNLSQEGLANQGKAPNTPLDDASKAGNTKFNKDVSIDDPTTAQNLIAKGELTSPDKNANTSGYDRRNVGASDGSPLGTGLGSKGIGTGSGLGFGDIEWGGGGNRIVTYKVLPKYPSGVNTAAQIKIRFNVSSDGLVTTMVPLQKGDPILEKAAMDALRQWRFNPLRDNKEMYGIITFTFKLS